MNNEFMYMGLTTEELIRFKNVCTTFRMTPDEVLNIFEERISEFRANLIDDYFNKRDF